MPTTYSSLPSEMRQANLMAHLQSVYRRGYNNMIHNTVFVASAAHPLTLVSDQFRLDMVKVLGVLERVIAADIDNRERELKSDAYPYMKSVAGSVFDARRAGKPAREYYVDCMLPCALQGLYGGIIRTEYVKRELADVQKLRAALEEGLAAQMSAS